MDVSALIHQMLILLILLIVGLVACKTGIVDDVASKKLSKIVININQSAMILAAVMNVKPSLSTGELFLLVGAAFVMYALLFLLSFPTPKLLRSSGHAAGAYRFMVMFSNVGYMGYPVIASLMGQEAVFYASLFNIPFNILVYSLGVMQLSGASGKSAFRLRNIINAPFISTFVAIGIFALGIPIPGFIADATDMLGDMIVPAAMLIIGASLGRMSLKEVFCDWRVYIFALIRLLLIPILVWAVLGLFITNQIILSIAVVIAAMPAATNATMLCLEYGGNEAVASRGVFVTTLLSVVTIPFVVWLLL